MAMKKECSERLFNIAVYKVSYPAGNTIWKFGLSLKRVVTTTTTTTVLQATSHETRSVQL